MLTLEAFFLLIMIFWLNFIGAHASTSGSKWNNPELISEN